MGTQEVKNDYVSGSGWTLDTQRDLLLLLREADEALHEERDKRYSEVQLERDRRYQEVAQEREKALKIKEQADRDALDLARQIQIYKDEKANELREQINSERGLYATHQDLRAITEKIDATLAPVLSFVAGQQGRSGGLHSGWGYLVGGIGLVAVIITVVVLIAGL